jgi:hypothetical protein
MVNIESANIFKGILEMQNLAKSDKVFAKTRPNRTCESGIYHTYINHAARLTGFYFALTHRWSGQNRGQANRAMGIS